MLHGRKRAALALTALATTFVIVTGPSPSSAEPDIDDVSKKVDDLYHEAEVAQERYHDAKLQLDEVNADLVDLRKDQALQEKRLDAARSVVEKSVVEQYQSQSLSAVSQTLFSEDPEAFLSQLATMSQVGDLQAEKFGDFTTELEALKVRRSETEERQTKAAELEKSLGDDKAEVDEKYDDAKDLLDELKEKERRELEASRSESRTAPASAVTAAPAPSGGAGAAVAYAMAQVGDSYVYGAAGPDAFDCSGLTMMAWAQAGVGLPHSSSAQMGSGTPVSSSALQPGDLVFYYSPVSHVGMYIGNGMIVHAANPGSGVTTAPLMSMPYSGAVRPG